MFDLKTGVVKIRAASNPITVVILISSWSNAMAHYCAKHNGAYSPLTVFDLNTIMGNTKEVCVRHGSVVRTASNSWSPETYSAEALAAESLPWPLSWASIICYPAVCCQMVGKCRTKLSGGECLEPALCWVDRLLVHHNTFLEVGPLQPLDYLSIIPFHMVSLVLFRVFVPCDEVYSVNSQSPPSVHCCARVKHSCTSVGPAHPVNPF